MRERMLATLALACVNDSIALAVEAAAGAAGAAVGAAGAPEGVACRDARARRAFLWGDAGGGAWTTVLSGSDLAAASVPATAPASPSGAWGRAAARSRVVAGARAGGAESAALLSSEQRKSSRAKRAPAGGAAYVMHGVRGRQRVEAAGGSAEGATGDDKPAFKKRRVMAAEPDAGGSAPPREGAVLVDDSSGAVLGLALGARRRYASGGGDDDDDDGDGDGDGNGGRWTTSTGAPVVTPADGVEDDGSSPLWPRPVPQHEQQLRVLRARAVTRVDVGKASRMSSKLMEEVPVKDIELSWPLLLEELRKHPSNNGCRLRAYVRGVIVPKARSSGMRGLVRELEAVLPSLKKNGAGPFRNRVLQCVLAYTSAETEGGSEGGGAASAGAGEVASAGGGAGWS